ncbi:Holliday junction branch migration protein RuvA [soil metagenome]
MIGRLRGRVLADDVDSVVIDVNGVGYDVTVPLGTMGRVVPDGDENVVLYVHTHVREDQLALFGFASEADRAAFRVLLGVSSVGPKTAIAVLSALPADDLARAVATKDVAKLTSVPGIGKKTAERLALELRDKLVPSSPSALRPATHPHAAANGAPAELLLTALVRMGYKAQEAERAVSQLGPQATEKSLPEALREALALLAK